MLRRSVTGFYADTLNKTQISLVDWIFFAIAWWQVNYGLRPHSTTPDIYYVAADPQPGLSGSCKDTFYLLKESSQVTYCVIFCLLLNGLVVMLGFIAHKVCPSKDVKSLPLVIRTVRCTSVISQVAIFMRFGANLYFTIRLLKIGDPCDGMHGTAQNSLLVCDVLGLVQVVAIVMLARMMARGREAEKSAPYLPLAGDGP
mmetsp:Transcript_63326/g.185149  ORF Transcript_63326/g.185149 Transcript_63326/m.185149 type:complete len:200 (-) Transcript_63326:75-674(-)